MAYPQMTAQVDKALEEKDLVKAGNYKQAIKHYYWVIFNLKGISNQESFRGHAVPGSVTPTSKITELENDDGDDGQDDVDDDEEEANIAKDIAKFDEEKYSFEAVKKTMAACYVNMAICHAKNNDWAKCKRCADDALKLENDNFKAKFRVAQATVRLGEIAEGRRKLEALKQERDDPAIANELKVLEAAEAARNKKHNESFKGFLKAGLGGPASPSRKPEDNQVSSPIIPDNQPRFTELKEEEIKAVAETPVKPKEGDNQLPPTPPQSN